MGDRWPKPLADAHGPMRADKVEGAALGMGGWGRETCALAAEGWLQPDLMTGLTLFILGNQPRKKPGEQKIPGAGGGVAGGVWVRERFTIHRPLKKDEPFVVTGEALGRHVHKGRRYGTNGCRTVNAAGEAVATNLTTGLLAYSVQEGLEDQVEGIPVTDIAAPAPDWSVAANNPCLERLRQLVVGETLGGYDVNVSLELMAARDTAKPDNPIHSDPELAKKAGLQRPIAGGSHVLSFALEPIMQVGGRHALLHGASFDVRWKAPVYADLVATPKVTVAAAEKDRVIFDIEVVLESGAVAMAGQITVPMPRE